MMLLNNKINTAPVMGGARAPVLPSRPSVAVRSSANSSSTHLEVAPKQQATVKQGQQQQSSPMFAATTTAQPVTQTNGGMSPGVVGGMAAMLGAGMLISKATGGDENKVKQVQAQMEAQLKQQQVQMQAQMQTQATQLQQQQAQNIARALEGKGVSSDEAAKMAKNLEAASLTERAKSIQKHFPTALSVDDYMNRVEVALASLGFTGDNSIAMSNLCRDESCMILEDKIESVFGSCFSTHGLGGVLTCGSIGIMAGLSHSPVMGGKEQYVFFSFPHVAIDSLNAIGKINRPNRPGSSSACGALCACLADFQKDGLEANCRVPGVHDAENPEYSILKQRLARQLKSENCNPADLDLVSITQAAERTITNDLEHLISQAVDTKKANYAVFTGVQIHNWAADLNDRTVPSLEFVSTGKSYVVIDGQRQDIDLMKVPPLAPRQLRVLGAATEAQHPENDMQSAPTTVQEIPRGYLLRRVGGSAGTKYVSTPAA